jgi:hypothetical protein
MPLKHHDTDTHKVLLTNIIYFMRLENMCLPGNRSPEEVSS